MRGILVMSIAAVLVIASAAAAREHETADDGTTGGADPTAAGPTMGPLGGTLGSVAIDNVTGSVVCWSVDGSGHARTWVSWSHEPRDGTAGTMDDDSDHADDPGAGVVPGAAHEDGKDADHDDNVTGGVDDGMDNMTDDDVTGNVTDDEMPDEDAPDGRTSYNVWAGNTEPGAGSGWAIPGSFCTDLAHEGGRLDGDEVASGVVYVTAMASLHDDGGRPSWSDEVMVDLTAAPTPPTDDGGPVVDDNVTDDNVTGEPPEEAVGDDDTPALGVLVAAAVLGLAAIALRRRS